MARTKAPGVTQEQKDWREQARLKRIEQMAALDHVPPHGLFLLMWDEPNGTLKACLYETDAEGGQRCYPLDEFVSRGRRRWADDARIMLLDPADQARRRLLFHHGLLAKAHALP